MKALLICPSAREGVAALAGAAPLASLPVFGRTLVEHWLVHLASLGAKEVLILAADRPEQVRALVGDGSRWGMHADVIPGVRELSPAEARAKYGLEAEVWMAAPDDAILMDHLPGARDGSLFHNLADFFRACRDWLPCAAAEPDRIGLRELKPGVWAGLKARVSPHAELRAPCWIGDRVFVGPGATIGPSAVLEANSIVERGAEISHSLVGPETFVGQFTEIHNSIAQGSRLTNWELGSTLTVPDDFLLCSLVQKEPAFPAISSLSRLLAALTLLLTLPAVLPAVLRAWLGGQPVLHPRIAVRPRVPGAVAEPGGTLVYRELMAASGWVRRWPQLWSIVLGDFAWVGNRPLSPGQAGRLTHDFDRLWLSAPIGLISLGDANGCTDCFSAEAHAHASYYAARMNWRLDLVILARALTQRVFATTGSRVHEWFPPVTGPARVEMQGVE